MWTKPTFLRATASTALATVTTEPAQLVHVVAAKTPK